MNAKYLNPTVCLIKYVAAIIAFDGLLRPSKMLVSLTRKRVIKWLKFNKENLTRKRVIKWLKLRKSLRLVW